MSVTPKSNKSKKRPARSTSEKKRDNRSVEIEPDLLKELRDKLKTEYQLEGKLNIAQIELAWGDLKTAKKIRHKEPPNQQTLRNFLNEEPKNRKYWLIDGLCQLLLKCSFEEWKEQRKQTKEVSQQKSPYEDVIRKQQAEIAEIKLLNSQSQLLLQSHDQLGALVAAVRAGENYRKNHLLISRCKQCAIYGRYFTRLESVIAFMDIAMKSVALVSVQMVK